MLGYGYDDVSVLRDMFDGGGAGQAGDEFQGGGILSLLANILASPYGSQQGDDQLARSIAGQASPRPQMAPASSMRPQMRPQGRPDDYMRAGQMTTDAPSFYDFIRADQLMRGDDVTPPADPDVSGQPGDSFPRTDFTVGEMMLDPAAPQARSAPTYDGRDEALYVPTPPERQGAPAVPADRAGPRAQPQSAKDDRALANVMAGDAASMRMRPAPAAPADTGPDVSGIPTRVGEVESALNQFRNNAVTPRSSAYMDLVNTVMDRGSPEQMAELQEILKGFKAKAPRNMSAEELSRGGNSPLASTRAPGP